MEIVNDEILISIAAGVIAIMFILLYMRYRIVIFHAQNVMQRVKKETQEISEISMSNPFPLIQISLGNKITFINTAALQAFPDITEQGFSHKILAGLDEVMREGVLQNREISIGNIVYHQTCTPSRIQNETTFTIYCFDITDRKKYERQLLHSQDIAEKARRQAEKANQARGDFLANMSHELRTPMNGIIGLSDILIESELNTEQQEQMEAINRSSKNLLILLNDILDFSKIEAGELTIEKIPFEVRQVFKQIEFLQRPLATRKGLQLSFRFGDEVPQFVIGDPARLQQILNNLIGNALKFTDVGEVRIEVESKKNPHDKSRMSLHIRVHDTGIGIPVEKQHTIFSKFQQADSSTARKYGGTGLGLAITKDLVKLLGGDLHLQSEVGKGTCVSVAVPVAHASTDQALQNDRNMENISGGICPDASILIVDDHPVNLLYMRNLLKKFGFINCDEAASGAEALQLYKTKAHELILMDCQMPDMNGYETSVRLREIGNRGGACPIIIAVTADAMQGARESCKTAGMDDYISKPVEGNALYALLQKYVPGHHKPASKIAHPNHGNKNKNAIENNTEKEAKMLESYPDIIDWQRLHDFTNGDKGEQKEILNIFYENLQIDIKNLVRSYHDKNYRLWDEAAHKIYGSCAHIGITSLAKICDQAQIADEKDKDTIDLLHHEIVSQYQEVKDVLKSYNLVS